MALNHVYVADPLEPAAVFRTLLMPVGKKWDQLSRNTRRAWRRKYRENLSQINECTLYTIEKDK